MTLTAKPTRREAIATAFDKKLGGVLSAAQKRAVEKAAEEAKKRTANKPDKPKK